MAYLDGEGAQSLGHRHGPHGGGASAGEGHLHTVAARIYTVTAGMPSVAAWVTTVATWVPTAWAHTVAAWMPTVAAGMPTVAAWVQTVTQQHRIGRAAALRVDVDSADDAGEGVHQGGRGLSGGGEEGSLLAVPRVAQRRVHLHSALHSASHSALQSAVHSALHSALHTALHGALHAALHRAFRGALHSALHTLPLRPGLYRGLYHYGHLGDVGVARDGDDRAELLLGEETHARPHAVHHCRGEERAWSW